MRHIFLSIAFLLSLAASAQITITTADLPYAGLSVLTATDTLTPVPLGTPGPSSQTWNFSSLSVDYYKTPTYGATSATPYVPFFPGSNIYTHGPAAFYSSFYGSAPVGTQGMNTGYMFWSNTASGFRIVGFRADSGTYANMNVLENPQELLIGTPATYGTSFNNSASWSIAMNVNPADIDTYYVNRSTKTLTGDAWGSLVTPFASYSQVLRIHEYLIKIDSAYAKMGSFTVGAVELSRDTLNNYIYMANGIGYPVCIVHADKNQSVKDVEWYDGLYTGIDDPSPGSESINVYPNPFVSDAVITVSGPVTGMLQCTVYDLCGREVKEMTSTDGTFHLQAEGMLQGMYIYTVKQQDRFIGSGKIIIAKE